MLDELANLLDSYLPSAYRRHDKQSDKMDKVASPRTTRDQENSKKLLKEKDSGKHKEKSSDKAKGRSAFTKLETLPNWDEVNDLLKIWLELCKLGILLSFSTLTSRTWKYSIQVGPV